MAMARRACTLCGTYLLDKRNVAIDDRLVEVVECQICDRRKCEYCGHPVAKGAFDHCDQLLSRYSTPTAGIPAIERWLAEQEAA